MRAKADSHLIPFDASRNRGAILGINILPDPGMRRAHPPASHVEERQHRLLVSLRARYSSDHRHSRPLSILAGELLLCHHHPVGAGFGTIHVPGTMGYIILVQWPVYDMQPEVLFILFSFNDRSPQ